MYPQGFYSTASSHAVYSNMDANSQYSSVSSFPSMMPTTTPLASTMPLGSTYASTTGFHSFPAAQPIYSPLAAQMEPIYLGSTFSTPTSFPTTHRSFPANFQSLQQVRPIAATFPPVPTLSSSASAPVSLTAEKAVENLVKPKVADLGPVKITYFGLKGRALFPMLVAEYGGIPYEWKKIAMEDWPALKDQTTFGQLPAMEHGDISIVQSTAIASYIGRLAGLLGTEDVDFAVSQMLVAQYLDTMNAFVKAYFGDNKAEDTDKFLSEQLPRDLGNLEKLVSGGFTNEKTIGEFAILAFLIIIHDVKPDCLDSFPALQAFYKSLIAHPRIAAFLPERAGFQFFKKDW